jgi:hypothetical protein
MKKIKRKIKDNFCKNFFETVTSFVIIIVFGFLIFDFFNFLIFFFKDDEIS